MASTSAWRRGLSPFEQHRHDHRPDRRPTAEEDTTEEFKAKISSERREVFEGLASRAAKLLRAAAYCARAPVALAWDARCDPVEVAALLKGDVAEGLQRAVGLFADGRRMLGVCWRRSTPATPLMC